MNLPCPTRLLRRLDWRLLAVGALLLVVLAVVVSCPAKAHAQAVVETQAAVFARIKAAVEQNTHGKVSVGAVVPTAIPGVYEIASGNEVMYVDATGRYALDGRMVDMLEQRDLTAARLEQLNRIDFQKLPLDLAIKTVHGNGKRMMAVFEDPACPMCRALSKFVDPRRHGVPLHVPGHRSQLDSARPGGLVRQGSQGGLGESDEGGPGAQRGAVRHDRPAPHRGAG